MKISIPTADIKASAQYKVSLTSTRCIGRVLLLVCYSVGLVVASNEWHKRASLVNEECDFFSR